MGFNEAQVEAIEHFEGACMVLAGPGSGKTTVITQRTKTLIEKQGVKPAEILVITFTKAAAKEMQERFFRLMGTERPPVSFGTFHAVFFKILKYSYGLSAANIVLEEQRMQWLRELVEREKLEIEDEGDFLRSIASEISQVKGERISLEYYYAKNCSNEVFQRIYLGYQENLKKSRKIDFDDMLVLTYELFTARADILAGWQKKYRFILIDEFQDINKVQYDTIRLLAKPEDNIFIVGDDDQSIYRFRGSKPEIMLHFPEDYPGAKRILLDWNYRCSKNIVETSLHVIEHNEKRFPKKIQASRPEGEKIECKIFQNPGEESRAILKQIRFYQERGYEYSDMAVLYRTNTDPRLLLERFMEYNIPFHMKEAMPNIFEHWIAKDILTYIRIATGSRARGDFLRIINRPKRYISRECLDTTEFSFGRLETFYEEKRWMLDRIQKLREDLEFLRDMSPYAAISYIRRGVEYDSYLKEYAEYRHLNAEELYHMLDQIQESAEGYFTFEEWFEHIAAYKQELEKQEREGETEQDKNRIEMVTLHGSKGLEYEIVFIIDVVEGVIPHQKAVLEDDLEEERRMFYVGMTRAKDRLHIYATKERYHKPVVQSRFLAETKLVPEEYTEGKSNQEVTKG